MSMQSADGCWHAGASVLLSSVTYAWLYGAAAAMYTSTSGVVTVLVFALIAIELKHKVRALFCLPCPPCCQCWLR